MQTTRNPKVLNNVLKYKLRPILDKISSLETIKEDNESYVSSIQSKVDSMKETATEEIAEYDEEDAKLGLVITKANKSLSNLIKNTLYNPNSSTVNTGSGTEIETTEETQLISDKTLEAACYGLVIDGTDYSMYSVTGKGIAMDVLDDNVQTKEYEWRNPANSDAPFPSYYVNDMLYIDSNTILCATNNGVVLYYIDTGKYSLMDKSYGLPSNKVYRLIKAGTKDGSISGFVAATEKGIAYSANGKQWTNIDSSFTESCVCLSNFNLIDTPQNLVFIGTSSGVYYIDIDRFLTADSKTDTEYRTVKEIRGLNLMIPSIYINGVAYDTATDTLAIVSLSGLVVISKVSELISSTESDNTFEITSTLKNSDRTLYYQIFSTAAGLNTSSCYDCAYTVDDKLIICTSNGLNITDDYSKFYSITKLINNYNPDSNEKLNSYICNRIIRMNDHKYTVLHGIGLTENITI